MPIFKSRTFRSGNSEAVRLPSGAALGQDVDVTIVRSGDVLTIYPVRMTLAELAKRLEALPAPPHTETRDTDEIPERSTL
ncbi:MAG: antitoxin [Hyphomonadaceae bacterium]